MSTQSYLDAIFGSYEDVHTKVDKESAQLRAKRDEIVARQQEAHVAAQQAVVESLAELRTYFTQYRDSALGGEGSQTAIAVPSVIERGLLPDSLHSQLSAFKSLATARATLLSIVRLEELSRKLQGLLQDAKDPLTADGANRAAVVDAYSLFMQIETSIASDRSEAHNSATKLFATKSLESMKSGVLKSAQDAVHQRLKNALKQCDWPRPESQVKLKASSDFMTSFSDSLKIESLPSSSSQMTPKPLATFQILCEELNMRFAFHFEGDRPTNRLDKPEWMLNFFTTTVEDHIELLVSTVQPLFNHTPQLQGRTAVHEFILGLLPPLYTKLETSITEILGPESEFQTVRSLLLSHYIRETLAFDSTLKDKFYFTPFGRNSWRGLTGDLLATSDWFNEWLTVEENLALSRYKEIFDSPSAWDIDWEAVAPGESKPTVSAISVKDLLESITDGYSKLSSVNHRLRFLLDIQINILDRYYKRLSESITAFDSLTSSLGRTVGGFPAADAKLVSGVAGLERLCRIYGSLSFIIDALEEWGESLFFLNLWADISKLSKKPSTSTAITIPSDASDDGTLFDETISSYRTLKSQVNSHINTHLSKELKSSMREYFRYGDWRPSGEIAVVASDDADDSNLLPSGIAISPKLVQPIKHLTKLLAFLRRAHSVNDYARSTRSFSVELSNYIWQYIVQANKFNQEGGKQLSRDVSELWTTLFLPHDNSLARLEQACVLLSAPAEDLEVYDAEASSIREEYGLTSLSADDILGIIKRRV